MKNKKSDQLDQIARDKLSQLHVEYKPQHWGQFEEMLEKQEAGVPVVEDRRLDEVVFEKLHNLKAGDRPAHWNLLAARMSEQLDVQEKLVLYKLMEASLLLLLLFVVTQFFPLNTTDSNASKNPVALQTDSNNSIQNSKILTEEIAESSTATTGQSDFVQLPKPSKNLIPTIDITKLRSLGKTTRSAEEEKQKVPSSENRVIKKTTTSPAIANSALKKPASNTEKPSLKETLAETKNSPPIMPKRVELMSALEQVVFSELEYNNGEPGVVALINPFKSRSGWVVSMFGSGDYNQIITPRSSIGDKELAELRRYAPGYSGGITAGIELGRWEIGGGAIYAAKKYQPRPIIRLGGSFFDAYDGQVLRAVELNMVQLPLYLRYNFIHHNKWRAYAAMGFSLQVNFQTNYYFEDESALLKSGPAPAPPPSSGEYTSKSEPKLPGGWLDGGTLWQNGYISGNVSIGLERYITGRWSIFAQPTYHHSLNYFTQGVGPDKDHINTMSIFTGVRVRLNN